MVVKSSMLMTCGEICRNYRWAKDKPKQIEILADMNRSTKEEIKKILKDGGEKIEKSKRSNQYKKSKERLGAT